jgi:hypothetical protein
MIELVKNSPAIPVHWGKNQAGMQAKEECTNGISWYKYEDLTPTDAWKQGMYNALEVAEAFSDAGYHKQIVNRLLEPFQMIKVVVTATEKASATSKALYIPCFQASVGVKSSYLYQLIPLVHSSLACIPA